MASAWITSIVNSSSHTLRFIQSDPNMHPVIASSSGVKIVEQGVQNPQGVQVQSGQTIEVAPGGQLTASWFAIPWNGFGTLKIKNNDKELVYTTGPQDGKDYLMINGAVTKSIPIGQQNAWQNLEFSVTVSDDGGLLFTPGNAQDFSELQGVLLDLAEKLLEMLLAA